MAPGLSGINPTQRFASSGNPKLQAHEKRGFSARLSYSDRSSYVLLSSDVFGNELVASPYGQLDGSVSYAYDDHWTIFANAINLTGEAAKIYSDTPTQRLSYSHVGRRFEVGLKARF